MSTRQWGVLGLLVLLNGFVFTLLFLLVQQVYFKPTIATTATPTVTKTPPPTATFTATIPSEPTPTFTAVVTPSPTATVTPTPTPTFTPGPPTATATPTGTATPTTQYVGSTPQYEPNCGNTWLDGRVISKDGAGLSGVLVRLWTDGYMFPLFESGKHPDRPAGYYEWNIGAGYARAGHWWVAIVDSGGNVISNIVDFYTTDTDCGNPNGRQHVVTNFTKNW